MGVVSEKAQLSAAEDFASALGKMEGVVSSVDKRSSGTQIRPVVNLIISPISWRNVAESLRADHGVDYCSMITGIHWPDADDKQWEVIYHFLRTGVKNPPILDGVVQPIITQPSKLKGAEMPLEIQISIPLGETRNPEVASIQDIWVGADWNEKETWDLVGIDFVGHEGMRRVLQPHETPKGYHPLQKQHKLRYHNFEEMYDDVQGFKRKPADSERIK
jgi:NADH:ubiquinone oxidoreductase subunit C|tara:strand:+ start:391 stop:1044 length:654 start_codon:yes stop_codon:yes gene_type:complete